MARPTPTVAPGRAVAMRAGRGGEGRLGNAPVARFRPERAEPRRVDHGRDGLLRGPRRGEGRARPWSGALDRLVCLIYGAANPDGGAGVRRCNAPGPGEGRARPVLVARAIGADARRLRRGPRAAAAAMARTPSFTGTGAARPISSPSGPSMAFVSGRTAPVPIRRIVVVVSASGAMWEDGFGIA